MTVRRIMIEVAATFACLAAVAVYQQLQDSTSPLRLRLAEWRERLLDESIRARVDDLIHSTTEEAS